MAETDTEETQDSSIIDQLRLVLRDGVDYGASVLRLLQAQATQVALSSFLFLLLVAFAFVSGIIGFLLISTAIVIYLTNVTGSAGWAFLIMSTVYFVMAAICGGVAIRWLKNLKS